MSQHDLSIANQGFPAFRSDLNDALQALGSLSSGDTAPTTTYANQLWYDSANNILKMRNEDDDAWISLLTLDQGTDTLTVVGALTLATVASTNTSQTFTAAQRGTVTSDNDLSFDLSATNNFSCTPTAGGTLTFTNHTAGQSGFILLDNSGGYAITAAATTKINAADLTTISTAGVYVLSYFDNGTNAYIMVSRSFS